MGSRPGAGHGRMARPAIDGCRTPEARAAEPVTRGRRLPAMKTTHRLAGLLTIVVLAVACSSGAAASAPAASSPPPNQAPSASPDPNAPVGTDVPPSDGTGGGDGTGDFIVPKPGQLDVHPVRMDLLNATVDGRHVLVTATWTSGVEPCNVLDTIIVKTGDHAFTITIREGHGAEQVACIEIAQIKRTRIDLGELEPGTYTITDSQGGATPIEVVVG